jgi:DUF4097 and DUF4098 domain-containing protein YvlB
MTRHQHAWPLEEFMKQVLNISVALCLLAIALPAHAEQWSHTYNISGKPDLRVETSDANIRVDTWNQNTIEATVISTRYKIGEGGLQIEQHQNGDTVEITVRYPHHGITFDIGNHRVDVNIHMPREGKVDLHTGDGKIEISNFKGEMNMRSGDGSQSIEGVDGKLRASTGDGHITADGRFDELELKTGDGRVDARASSGSSVAGDWRVETGDGNVTLEVPGNLAADVALQTGDGHIDLDLPVVTEGKLKQNQLRGKLNVGGNLMTIHTGDGSIHLRKG